MSNWLELWTIYDHPRDLPNCYVARKHRIECGVSVATAEIIIAPTLDRLRDVFVRQGLIRMTRHPDDDAVIVETWV